MSQCNFDWNHTGRNDCELCDGAPGCEACEFWGMIYESCFRCGDDVDLEKCRDCGLHFCEECYNIHIKPTE